MADPATFNVQIITPYGIIYDQQVEGVSAINETGPLSILPQHTNFISTISGQVILHEKGYQAQSINVGRAVLCVEDGNSKIFAGIMMSAGPTEPALPTAPDVSPPASA